MQKEDQMIL